MLGPTLHGRRVRLEPAGLEDIEYRIRWFADLELAHYWTDPSVPTRVQEEEHFHRMAADDKVVRWRVVVNDRTIGHAWLADIDWMHRQARQAMYIGERAEWGKGYATEVVALRTEYAFTELGLRRLETSSLVGNVGMHRALQRSGFRQIGRRSERYFIDGARHDELLFELLRAEWDCRGKVGDMAVSHDIDATAP